MTFIITAQLCSQFLQLFSLTDLHFKAFMYSYNFYIFIRTFSSRHIIYCIIDAEFLLKFLKLESFLLVYQKGGTKFIF